MLEKTAHGLPLFALLLGLTGCGGGGDEDSGSDADTGGDADVDSDADSDSDADQDQDIDQDADRDPDRDQDPEMDADPDADPPADGDSEQDAEGDGDGDTEIGGFSFAIMTDVHVGEGLEDYGGAGFDDSGGDEYAVTETIRSAVDAINGSIDEYGIDLVVVLGDLTDSGEVSELEKAREILDGLEVPYFPLLGNHDVWPYTSTAEAAEPIGDTYFDSVFGDELVEASSWVEGFVRAEGPVPNPEHGGTSFFINYAFDHRGFHFVALDLVTREHAWLDYPGVLPAADLHDFEGGTWQWLTDHLDGYEGLGDHNVLVFLHHPPIVTTLGVDCLSLGEHEQIDAYIRDSGLADSIFGFFAGHHHLDYDLEQFQGQQVVATAATKDGRVRVVQIGSDGAIDFATLL